LNIYDDPQIARLYRQATAETLTEQERLVEERAGARRRRDHDDFEWAKERAPVAAWEELDSLLAQHPERVIGAVRREFFGGVRGGPENAHPRGSAEWRRAELLADAAEEWRDRKALSRIG